MRKKITAETQLKKSVIQLLKFHKIVNWPIVASMGSPSGLPDRFGILPGGKFLAIEFKRPERIGENGRKIPQGELTEKQIEIKQQIEAAGGRYIVCRSLEDIIDGLQLGGRLF